MPPLAGRLFRLLDGQPLADAEFLHALAEGCACDAKQLRGLNLVSLCFDQGLNDEFSLDRWNYFELRVQTGAVK